MRTKEQYFTGLSKLRRNLYYRGERIGRDHEDLAQASNVLGVTFDAAYDPEIEHLCTATSHLTANKISRFCHVHQSTDDLHNKQDMTRILCRKTGYCIGRCMGTDALNAIYAVSYEADQSNKRESAYHANFVKWLEYFQGNDLAGSCAQTDVKGERMKRPSMQTDPDAYLRVVERNSDGIVVRGCKVHISYAAVADEILVIPTRALVAHEKDYAVAFAVPSDYEGVKHVLHPHNVRKRQHVRRGFDFGAIDSYVIFDDVFVPWSRVFLCGETQHASICAMMFALFHRHSYSGCKPAVGDIMVGMAALVAEVNGIEKADHVRAHLAELITIAELGYAAGYTASATGGPHIHIPGLGMKQYGPGAYIPNSIYANVGRYLTGDSVYREHEILCKLAGGMPATFPYEQDLFSEELKPLLEKYIKRNPLVPVEEQIKFWLFFGDMECSSTLSVFNYAGVHGGGSPVMEQIAITSQYDIKARKDIVKGLAGMDLD